jgi:hypothetical protein
MHPCHIEKLTRRMQVAELPYPGAGETVTEPVMASINRSAP